MKNFTMKTMILFTFLAIASSSIAQDYQIEFAILDEVLKPETVLVENLSQGTSLELNGDDILNLTDATGLSEIPNQDQGIHLFPNPMKEQFRLEYKHTESGVILIQITDLLGKVVLEYSEYYQEGLLSFQVQGMNSGSYIVNVKNMTSSSIVQKSISAICISQNHHQNKASISLIGMQSIFKDSDIIMGKQGDKKEIIDMPYHAGDELHFTALLRAQPAYKNLIIEESQTLDFEFETLVFDVQDNIYLTKVYNNQNWMIENLSAEVYQDSTEIPTLISDYDWTTATTPAYCWRLFDEETAREQNLGALYNWYAVETENICPIGWHVPTDGEFEEFVFYLAANGYNYDGTIYEGNNIDEAGSKIGKALAEKSNWREPEYGEEWAIGKDMHLNNSSGFNGIGADGRYMSTGEFYWDYYLCNWWTSTASEAEYSWTYFMYTEDPALIKTYYFKQGGYSVRCIEDAK